VEAIDRGDLGLDHAARSKVDSGSHISHGGGFDLGYCKRYGIPISQCEAEGMAGRKLWPWSNPNM
jgi:hypothetical protein